MELKNSDSNSQKIVWTKIESDLFPVVDPFRLIGKISFIQMSMLILILSICPQFGLGIFKNGHYGLTSLFMLISHEFCQLACGGLLFTSTLLALHFNLKITEIEWLQKNKMVFSFMALALTSTLFWMFAPEIYLLTYIIWAAGAVLSQWAYFEYWSEIEIAS